MTDAHPSVRAIVCTAHLLVLQNPKATGWEENWHDYMCLVRDWCLALRVSGEAVYWSPGIHEGTRH